jgi:selenocysteine lyase/cysteine desulfurase
MKPKGEWRHLAPMAARLNHGSFGACPWSVLQKQNELRAAWLAYPDQFYFSGELARLLEEATASAARAVGVATDRACLVENASVATSIVANRWALAFREGLHGVRPGDVVLMLEWRYGAVENAVRATCERAGARVVTVPLPFPLRSEEEILVALDTALRRERPRFVLLDHISSQPAVVMPIRDMVALVRGGSGKEVAERVVEVAVDAAHALGSEDLLAAGGDTGGGDQRCVVDAIGADWWYSNIHKWAFAPPAVAVLVARDPALLDATEHVTPSWSWPRGLREGARWVGTRDYSAFLAVPRALEFLEAWRAGGGRSGGGGGGGGGGMGTSGGRGELLTAQAYNRAECARHLEALSVAWGREPFGLQPKSTVGAMGMVQLPRGLEVTDVPGVPGEGFRATLVSDTIPL